jgi:hypothetical protein
LKLLRPDALVARQKAAGRPDRAAGVRVGMPPGIEVPGDQVDRQRPADSHSRGGTAVKAKR